MIPQTAPLRMIHITPEDIKLYGDVEILSPLIYEQIGYSPDSVSAVMVGAKHVPWKTPCRFCREIKCPYRRENE